MRTRRAWTRETGARRRGEDLARPARRILVAVELGTHAAPVLDAGLGLADAIDAEVWVVYVCEPIRALHGSRERIAATALDIEAAETYLEHELDRRFAAQATGRLLRRHVHPWVYGGHAAEEILATARFKAADLIVLGARSHDDEQGMRLGATAGRILRRAGCSVLCVRPPDTPEPREG